MKRMKILFIGALILFLCPNPLFAISYFGYNGWGGTYYDSHKYSFAHRADEIGWDINLWRAGPALNSLPDRAWEFEFDAEGDYSNFYFMDNTDSMFLRHHLKHGEVSYFELYQDTVWNSSKQWIHSDSRLTSAMNLSEMTRLATAPSPAPAISIMLLLGIGLIGWAGYNTKKFKTLGLTQGLLRQ